MHNLEAHPAETGGSRFNSFAEFYREYEKRALGVTVFLLGKSLVASGDGAKMRYDLADDLKGRTKIVFHKIGSERARVNLYDDNRLAYCFTLDDKNIRDFSFEMAG